MKPARKLTVAVITAATLLAGAPAALAATAQAGHTATAGTAATPNAFHWIAEGTYPTQHACRVAGSYYPLHVNSSYIYSCVEFTEGDYFVWKLYVGVPE